MPNLLDCSSLVPFVATLPSCKVIASLSGQVTFEFHNPINPQLHCCQRRHANFDPMYNGSLIHRAVVGLHAPYETERMALAVNGVLVDIDWHNPQDGEEEMYLRQRALDKSSLADIAQLEIVPCVAIDTLRSGIVVAYDDVRQSDWMTKREKRLTFIRRVLGTLSDETLTLTSDLGMGCRFKITAAENGQKVPTKET
jgi:hypothetical protein